MAKDSRAIATFDLETDPFKYGRNPKPFASDFFTGERHSTTFGNRCLENLLESLLKFKGIAYAHNGGKFDFHFLLPLLPRRRINKFLSIGGRVVQIGFEGGLELRDSYALIPRPLREWAKEDIDYRKLESDVRDFHHREIVDYLKKDTEYLYEMVTQFTEEYGSHLTLASAAFKILHTQFQVKRTHISESQDAKFRSFYFAGRVEFHELGELKNGPFSCVDINSSFPWSMTQDHWEGEAYITQSCLPVRNLNQSFLRVMACATGSFPFREHDGSVSFPSDGIEREFFVTGWEFVTAASLSLLRNCRIIAAYTPISIRNYKEYIDHFYRIKSNAELSGSKGERLFAKLLMNSGYGKFGMDPREFEETKICEWRESPGDDWSIQKDDPALGITIYKKPAPIKASSFNNVCVAASITGCSRALLLRSIHKCKGVVYCDTDSIIARDTSQLKIGTKLGEWKEEHLFSKLFIGGKKLYAGYGTNSKGELSWKTASKGVRLTADEICEVARGKDVTYTFDAPSYTVKKLANTEKGETKWTRFQTRKIRRADKMQNKVLQRKTA